MSFYITQLCVETIENGTACVQLYIPLLRVILCSFATTLPIGFHGEMYFWKPLSFRGIGLYRKKHDPAIHIVSRALIYLKRVPSSIQEMYTCSRGEGGAACIRYYKRRLNIRFELFNPS